MSSHKSIDYKLTAVQYYLVEDKPQEDVCKIFKITPKSLCYPIQVKKIGGKCIASVFVKSHKWNEMKHGASLWKKEEQVLLLKHVIDKVLETF